MRVLGLAALALAALTFGIAVAAGAFQQGSNVVKAVVPPSPAPAELAAIQQLVLRAAARMGDPSPTDGVLVPTTRRLLPSWSTWTRPSPTRLCTSCSSTAGSPTTALLSRRAQRRPPPRSSH